MRYVLLLVVLLAVVGIVAASRWGDGARDSDAIPASVGQTMAVTVQVEHILDPSKVQGLYSGKARFTFSNRSDRLIHLKLPAVRRLSITPTSVQYIDGVDGPWAEQKFVEIPAKGQVAFESEFGMSISEDPTQEELVGGRAISYRYAWVFDVPDNEPAGDWLSGTIISDPVVWRRGGGPN